MNIAKHAVVAIQYELKNDNGEVLDSSAGRDALVYLHGTGALIPGLESELEGKSTGDKLQVSVAPADAYGEANPDLIQEVPREVFQGIENVEVGMQFQTDTQSGPRIITVSKVDGDVITIDGNHPLAGEQLHFSVEIESVREATEEEISHGHAH